VDHSAFKDHCWRGVGGAISSRGSLVVKNSTFTNNFAEYGGGAIYATGTVALDNCEFSRNGGFGGGGVAFGTEIDAEMTKSTLSGNVARVGGAVISSATTVMVRRSEMFDNYADFGAGLYLAGVPATEMTVRNTRITRNTARVKGGGIYRFGHVDLSMTGNPVTGNMPDDIAP
jgi:predicted outer membrane repeat protein